MDRLNAMQVFRAVVDSGSFSAAARRLDIGQPAVSKTVAALEERLGVRLLVRTTRQQTLTEAGRRFYERSGIALDEVDAAEAAARDEAASLSGTLRVSAPPLYASAQIIPRLETFLAAHPELAVEFVLDDQRIDLVEAGVDLALRAGALPDSSLVARRIDRARRLIVASPAYLERHGGPERPDDLARHAAVTYSGFQASSEWSFEGRAGPKAVAVRSVLRVDSALGLRTAVLAGLGIGMVSERMIEPELADGSLVELLAEWALPRVDVWAVYPSGHRPPLRARAFVDWLEQALRDASPRARSTRT